MAALGFDLDILGQQPGLFKLYTQICFIFSIPDSVDQPPIAEALTRGLERLSDSFPWVAGQVVNTHSDAEGTPFYKIRPFERIPKLVVKDYGSDTNTPTLSELREARYPFSMLHESIWAPCPTLATLSFDPTKPSGESSDPAPVLLLQANFIKGGLVLCINMQHNTADMSGQGAVMKLLSKACHGEEFTEEELRIGNAERKNMIPLIEEEGWKPGKELESQLLPAQPATSPAIEASTPDLATLETPPPPPCSWVYFTFSAYALSRLKDLATRTLPSSFTGYITTDDALSALIYQSVLRARSPRLSSQPSRVITFARAVDARRYFEVPAGYPGVLQNMAYTSYQLITLLARTLGEIAAEMRRHVDPSTSNMAYATRSLATFLSQSPGNYSRANTTANVKPDADIMLSSWAKVNAYELDFGLGLGLPEAVRRPSFVPLESLMYIMPKARDGEIAVAMCLREEDLQRLRVDHRFTEFARYVG
ncbi:trichothecene 3-O-acetyltransferase [Trematosphaeria pertusa]|uniref:Trichothecene 3-O-acetyltransferase n=1 Tax=Trematosphaeria pertusa TaxID=390896 RepID=A0A6A6HTF3_9PLEO|nr:trichothecene 3-O-acetyltransferase [Trematosphaeria pertusa]KAF2240710.1 trichothecene 3-O-acetyltransferase [Trematosphaeria pertusa]